MGRKGKPVVFLPMAGSQLERVYEKKGDTIITKKDDYVVGCFDAYCPVCATKVGTHLEKCKYCKNCGSRLDFSVFDNMRWAEYILHERVETIQGADHQISWTPVEWELKKTFTQEERRTVYQLTHGWPYQDGGID